MLERIQIVICGGESCHQLKSLELKDRIESTLETKKC